MDLNKLVSKMSGVTTLEIQGVKVVGSIADKKFKSMRAEFTPEQVAEILKRYVADLLELKNPNNISVTFNTEMDRHEETSMTGVVCVVSDKAESK